MQSQGAASNLPLYGLHLQLQASVLLHICSQFPWRCRQPQRHLRTGAHASWLVAATSGSITTQQWVRWGWSAQGQEQAPFRLFTAGAGAGAGCPSWPTTPCHDGPSHRQLRPHLDRCCCGRVLSCSCSRPHWCRGGQAGCSWAACWGSCRVARRCGSKPRWCSWQEACCSRGACRSSWRQAGCCQGASAAVPADQAGRRLPVCHALPGSCPGASAASTIRWGPCQHHCFMGLPALWAPAAARVECHSTSQRACAA